MMIEGTSAVNPIWNKPNGGATVAVIGCGPGGMSVCHALECERLRLMEALKDAKNDEDRTALGQKIDSLPSIMCFEQANAPGGVWRSPKSTGTGATFKTDTVMYEALWCNGPKEVMEFHDYSFVDHFKTDKLPLFLPRQAVLQYILSRVTRNCPDFFEKYAQFETRVETVTYDKEANHFRVETTHLPTKTTTSALYDKVIWSGGQNGRGSIPPSVKAPFEAAEQRFVQQAKGPKQTLPPFLHASSMEQKVAEQINGRHLLLIGGAYSAEDLAYMGIKWGAKHITVLTRRHGLSVPISWAINWPDNKVTVIAGYVVQDAEVVVNREDGSLSYTVIIKKYEKEIVITEVEETPTPQKDGESPLPPTLKQVEPFYPKSIDNVDVVICCTGYTENFDMIDRTCYNMTDEEYEIYKKGGGLLDLPEDWTMPQNILSGIVEKYHREKVEEDDGEEKKSDDMLFSEMTKRAKHIPPKRDSLPPGEYLCPYRYREFVFVHNPNLFCFTAENFDAPLFALDVEACLAFKFLTGERRMPTLQQMKAENREQALTEMTIPIVRYYLDPNYFKAVQMWLAETVRKVHFIDAKGNRSCRYDYPQIWEDAYEECSRYALRILARLMEECDYPLQFGNICKLNELGEQFLDIDIASRNYETCAKEGTTFRDAGEEQCSKIKSLLTGCHPVPLKGRWLDMDDLMENVSDMVS